MIKFKNKKLKESSKKWISRQISDVFTQEKKIQGYRSRSAFKLIDIQKKFKFLKNNSLVLDLGSSPGGWSQVLAKKIKKGKIVSVDILPMKKIDKVTFILGDFLSPNIKKKILELFNGKVDIIVSDMAANTTGNKNLDSYRTSELNFDAIDFSQEILNKNGILLCKLFMGAEFKEIRKKASSIFKKVVFYKPNPSRQDSREIYMYCNNLLEKSSIN